MEWLNEGGRQSLGKRERSKKKQKNKTKKQLVGLSICVRKSKNPDSCTIGESDRNEEE